MNDVIEVESRDAVCWLTLNRPEQLNAMTWELMRRLHEELERAALDPGVRVVVLAGAGRGFCAGGDLRGPDDPHDGLAREWSRTPRWTTPEQRALQVQRHHASTLLLHTMGKPTIAMIQGATAGAGLCLAAACDFRIASPEAFFTTAFVNAARSGDFGGSYLLTRLVGPARVRELYLLGDRVPAEEALRVGLVTRVVPLEALRNEVTALAARLAAGPPIAYYYIKKNLHAAETLTLAEVLELESHHMMRCSTSEDAREAAVAARERRPPRFQGI